MTPPKPNTCASLAIGADHVELHCPLAAPVELPWDAYGTVGAVMDHAPARDRWTILPFAAGRGGTMGIAVQVSGMFEGVAHDLIAATMNWHRRIHHWRNHYFLGDGVPVVPSTTIFSACTKERATLSALLLVLQQRTDLRERLQDGPRMQRLATDLNAKQLVSKVQPGGTGRDSVDIVVALHQLGYFHEFGRPLAASTLAPFAALVS